MVIENMIKEEKVKVKLNSRNIKYYEELGYNIPKYLDKKGRYSIKRGTEIEVDVNDLSNGSHVEITAVCDICEENKVMPYKAYMKNISKYNVYTCPDCSTIKVRQTYLEKYGVDCSLKSNEVKEKIIQTNIERYGVKHCMQNSDIKAKTQNTIKEKYGVDYLSQSEEILNKVKNTNLKKYGQECYLHSKDFEIKNLKALKEKYGENITHNMQVPEVRRKATLTKFKNGKCATSAQQIHINNLYNTLLNYPFMNYNFDMFDDKYNIDIEYDGSGHDLSVKLNKVTNKMFFKKQMSRDILSKINGIKIFRIISSKDKLPTDEILLDMYSKSVNILRSANNKCSSIYWNIDNGTYTISPFKKTFTYDYGKLRKLIS